MLFRIDPCWMDDLTLYEWPQSRILEQIIGKDHPWISVNTHVLLLIDLHTLRLMPLAVGKVVLVHPLLH